MYRRKLERTSRERNEESSCRRPGSVPVSQEWMHGPRRLHLLAARPSGSGGQAVAVEVVLVPLVNEHGCAGKSLAASLPSRTLRNEFVTVTLRSTLFEMRLHRVNVAYARDESDCFCLFASRHTFTPYVNGTRLSTRCVKHFIYIFYA